MAFTSLRQHGDRKIAQPQIFLEHRAVGRVFGNQPMLGIVVVAGVALGAGFADAAALRIKSVVRPRYLI